MEDAKKPAVAIESATKHGFTKEEVEDAWMGAQGSWRMVRKDKWPPHYMAFGRIGNRDVEMIAYSTGTQFVIFHAKSPVGAKFKREYGENGR